MQEVHDSLNTLLDFKLLLYIVMELETFFILSSKYLSFTNALIGEDKNRKI
jgi:hypothetical protein